MSSGTSLRLYKVQIKLGSYQWEVINWNLAQGILAGKTLIIKILCPDIFYYLGSICSDLGFFFVLQDCLTEWILLLQHKKS